jgi:hypothetical protein
MIDIDTKLIIRHKLLGTACLDAVVCDEYNIDIYQLEELMLDVNCERCPACEYWMESCELADDNGEPCACSECRRG